MLKYAYDRYRENGFIMLRTAENQKFSAQGGAYIDRTSDPFTSDATGYACIVPPHIIIVDNDSYKDGGESFKAFLSDMGYTAGSITPFAKTPSGGEHYAFINPHQDKRIGAKQGVDKKYPYLDVFTGYQSVIPCVGTTAFSKHLNGIGTYEWADDNYEEDVIINPWNPRFLTLFDMRDRGSSTVEDFDDISYAVKAEDMSDDEVLKLLDGIPNKVLDYDGLYIPVALALYDRYQGEPKGLEMFQYFCAKVESGNDPEQNTKKWDAGHFKGDMITYKKLRSLYKSMYFKEKIATATTEEELVEVIAEIKDIDSMLVDNVDLREPYAKQINARYKDVQALLKKEGKQLSTRVPQVSRILTDMTPSIEHAKPESGAKTRIYLCDGRNHIQHGSDLFENIATQMVGKYLRSLGYGKVEADGMMEHSTLVNEIRTQPDYMLDGTSLFTLIDRGDDQVPDLLHQYNPLSQVKLIAEDKDILNDFLHDIWASKVDDIVKLIALTIKFEETKLNRLMLVAPSNAGKSVLFKHMGFQEVALTRLLASMRGTKGMGMDVIAGIKQTGLMMIDEANTALPSDVKDMDDTLYVDQFGSGGTQKLKLHFTTLTSTHKTATSYNSDELYNRFLQIELNRDEMRHTIVESPYYSADTKKYSNVVRSYMVRTFKEWLHSDVPRSELTDLQAKYRLPVNESFTDTLLQLSEEIIAIHHDGVTDEGDIIERDGIYYIKRKGDLKNQITMLVTQLHQTTNLDVGKYVERLYEHFVGDSHSKAFKMNNISTKYYSLNLAPYYEDAQQAIISQFDDLDMTEL